MSFQNFKYICTMKKEEQIKIFIDAIKKSDIAIVHDVTNTEYYFEEGFGVYCEFEYQIDDRIERMDSEVSTKMKEIIGAQYGVSLDRVDAFPNGYAAYKLTIDE